MTGTQTKQNKREYVAIFIRPETRKQLALVKVARGFKSYDDVIMYLLRQAEHED
jgi:guanylate kinase